MAPTICTDDDKRCRHSSIREARKENSSSSFSVINYVGKKSSATGLGSTKKKKHALALEFKNLSDELDTTPLSPVGSSLSSSSSSLASTVGTATTTSSPSPASCYGDNYDGYSERMSDNEFSGIDDDDDENMNEICDRDENSIISNSSSFSIVSDEEFYSHRNEICKKIARLMNFRYSVKYLNNNDNILNNSSSKNNCSSIKSTSSSSSSSSIFNNQSNTKKLQRNSNGGLIEIALRTVHLIQRNQLLQAKLAQLQAETQAFITSVMANPENRELREQIENKKL